jgi:hypothetical protein
VAKCIVGALPPSFIVELSRKLSSEKTTRFVGAKKVMHPQRRNKEGYREREKMLIGF